MRKVKRWRFYCDFCKKSGCSSYHIAKHERGCTRNPNRECGMCKAAGDIAQQPMADLLAALRDGGLEKLKEVAESCPACILSALVQDRMANPIVNIAAQPMYDYVPSREYIEFDFKAACTAFWKEVDAAKWESERYAHY